jgi:cold shock CspA family protein/ribosome-associated translation inhibitor RaiA
MQTPLRIAFKDMPSSARLESLVRKRVERLDAHHAGIIGCRVVLETPHRSSEGHKTPLGLVVEVTIPRRLLIARERAAQREVKNDHLAVINRAFDAIERQLEDEVRQQRREVKHHEAEGEIGRVASLSPEDGYGLIEVKEGSDLYFTRKAVKNAAFDALEVGMMARVTRAATEGPMGPQASSVLPLGREIAPE